MKTIVIWSGRNLEGAITISGSCEIKPSNVSNDILQLKTNDGFSVKFHRSNLQEVLRFLVRTKEDLILSINNEAETALCCREVESR